MHIIKLVPPKAFWSEHPDAKEALEAWIAEARNAVWIAPNELEATYANASIIGNERVVFNIRGNRYRLVVAVRYRARVVLVKFIGMHDEYDRIDAEGIEL